MGYALMWFEGLAVALLAAALATAWAARGRRARLAWPAMLYLVFALAAAALSYVTFNLTSPPDSPVRTTFVPYALAWLAAFSVLGALVVWQGSRRPGPGLARAAADWSRRRLWLCLGCAVLALGLTFWNLDLAARAELAVARQEAGAILLAMTPAPVADADNAARLYAEAAKDLGEPIREPWFDAVERGLDSRHRVDWKDPALAEMLHRHEPALALLRKAAAWPRCNFGRPRTLLHAVASQDEQTHRLRRTGIPLLAIDARVEAARGNLPRAFEDVAAILGMVRHLAENHSLLFGAEAIAWRALEDVLSLAPIGKGPLPPFTTPELVPLVRKVREEHALIGLILPAAASQPALLTDRLRERDGPLTAFLVETFAVPPTRVFIIPDELAAMRKLFEDYRRAPIVSREESPQDWAELRDAVAHDQAGYFSAYFIKPKQRMLASEGARLAALREAARTGLAAAAYQRRHGHYPERLEQLVPEFLSTTPTDPRDGRPLQIRPAGEFVVIVSAQDAATVEKGKVQDPDNYRPPPLFRLPRR